jgi:anti-anti-sigma factor
VRTTTRDVATGPVLEITDDLDHTLAPELCEPLTGLALQPGRRLVLDLAGMDFHDSSGVTALIVARHHAHAAQADIALVGVPSHALRVLDGIGLDQIFPFHLGNHSATRS